MTVVQMLVFGIVVLGLSLALVLLPAIALSLVLRLFVSPAVRRPPVVVRDLLDTWDDIPGVPEVKPYLHLTPQPNR